MQQPPPVVKKSGGAGKWFVIIPLVLGLAGGGGWYGWKVTHSDTIKDDPGKKDPGKDDLAKEDWLKKGDEARDRADYHDAVKCYRRQPAAGAARIAAVQALVESDVEAKVAKFSDLGQFEQAAALVDEWLTDFPASDRLKAQKDLIVRRRAAQ